MVNKTEKAISVIRKLKDGDLNQGIKPNSIAKISAEFGISPQLLNKVLTGGRKIKPYEIQIMIKVWNVNPDYFEGRSEEMFTDIPMTTAEPAQAYGSKAEKYKIMEEFLDTISPQIKGHFTLEPGLEYNPHDNMKIARIVFNVKMK